MALTDVDRLRQLLGEEIPSGGTEADTLFTNEQIQDFLTSSDDDLTAAAALGWRAKAAEVAGLVDISEGNASRSLGQVHKHALAMAEFYGGGDLTTGATARRTVIRKITRRTS